MRRDWICGACGGEGRHLTSCSRTLSLSPKDIKIRSYEAFQHSSLCAINSTGHVGPCSCGKGRL